jgi:WD40 repeat protein
MTRSNRRHTLQPDKLLVALSTGSFALYTLDLGGESPQLHHIETYEQFPNSTLVLSIAVEEKSAAVLATLSTGEVSILDVDTQRATSRQMWKAHDLEVWCSAWKTPNEILTGGDDALLRLWDLRDQDPNCTIQSGWSVHRPPC